MRFQLLLFFFYLLLKRYHCFRLRSIFFSTQINEWVEFGIEFHMYRHFQEKEYRSIYLHVGKTHQNFTGLSFLYQTTSFVWKPLEQIISETKWIISYDELCMRLVLLKSHSKRTNGIIIFFLWTYAFVGIWTLKYLSLLKISSVRCILWPGDNTCLRQLTVIRICKVQVVLRQNKTKICAFVKIGIVSRTMGWKFFKEKKINATQYNEILVNRSKSRICFLLDENFMFKAEYIVRTVHTYEMSAFLQ